MIRLICLNVLALFLVSCSSAPKLEKKSVQDKSSASAPAALKLYDGPDLSAEEVAKVMTEQSENHHMYFISVGKEKITGNGLLRGVDQILLKPGQHELRVRFVVKGTLAIPLKAFSPVKLEAGKKYIVKSTYKIGEGDYISSAKNTKVNAWIEEVGSKEVLAKISVNGFGK